MPNPPPNDEGPVYHEDLGFGPFAKFPPGRKVRMAVRPYGPVLRLKAKRIRNTIGFIRGPPLSSVSTPKVVVPTVDLEAIELPKQPQGMDKAEQDSGESSPPGDSTAEPTALSGEASP